MSGCKLHHSFAQVYADGHGHAVRIDHGVQVHAHFVNGLVPGQEVAVAVIDFTAFRE
jgi:hypothetical protein